MIKRKNMLELLVLFLASILATFCLFFFNLIDVNRVALLGNDLQYSIIATSSVIAGFLFTGVSIMLASMNSDVIRRLWNYNYLDNLYRSAFFGIGCYIISILIAYISVYRLESNSMFLLFAETLTFICGFLLFSTSLRYLYKTIGFLKNTTINQDIDEN